MNDGKMVMVTEEVLYEYYKLKELCTPREVCEWHDYDWHNPNRKLMGYCCPNCDEELERIGRTESLPCFCPSCGQRLDWTKEEYDEN